MSCTDTDISAKVRPIGVKDSMVVELCPRTIFSPVWWQYL